MYSINGIYIQQFKRKVVAIAFAFVLLAEFGEFFVPKNVSTHLEISDHIPEVSAQHPTHKKEKPKVQNIYTQRKFK